MSFEVDQQATEGVVANLKKRVGWVGVNHGETGERSRREFDCVNFEQAGTGGRVLPRARAGAERIVWSQVPICKRFMERARVSVRVRGQSFDAAVGGIDNHFFSE